MARLRDAIPEKLPPAAAAPAPNFAAPALGDIVIIKTATPIRGQGEHPAIVTRVLDGGVIDALLIPAGDAPYPVSSVPRSGADRASLTWRARRS